MTEIAERSAQIPRWAFERMEDERCAYLGVKPNYANIDVWIKEPESWIQYHAFAWYIAQTERCPDPALAPPPQI